MKIKMWMPSRVSQLRAIRRKCVECSGNSSDEVKGCLVTDCPLFPYRFGKSPNTIKDYEQTKGWKIDWIDEPDSEKPKTRAADDEEDLEDE